MGNIEKESFDEAAYLKANPDVAVAVHHREFTSGEHHYRIYGRREGRPLAESDVNNPRVPASIKESLEHDPESVTPEMLVAGMRVLIDAMPDLVGKMYTAMRNEGLRQ